MVGNRLVGRQDDLARISAIAEQAAAGRGGIAVITGEPGIGKTSLLDAVSGSAAAQGARLLRGTAAEIEQEVPYAALGWCLGFGHGKPDPAAAQLHSLLRGVDLPGDGAFSRHFAVVETLLALVDQWCTTSPVMLILDDANWADSSSLAVLERLGEIVGELPLTIIVAVRPLPRGDSLAALLKQFHAWGAAQLQLTPLTEPEVATLIEDTIGAVPGPALTAAVAGAGGNPFYVVELVTGLRQADALTVVGRGFTELATAPTGRPERFTLPESLTETVERRLDFLPRAARQVLTMAAALGTGIEAMELSAVLDMAVIEIWEAISTATAAGLLVESRDELVFRHDLLRQVFADQVPASIRKSLRQRAGRVLITAGAPAERIANHLLAGDAPLDDHSLRWLADTAETLTVRAPELAINLLAGAVADSGSEHPDHANFRVQYVRALLWSGRAADAETTAEAILATRPSSDTPASPNDKALQWLLVRAHYAQGRLDDAAATANLVLAQPGLTRWEDGLYNAFLALFYFFAEKFDVAEQAAVRAISIGDDMDDPLTVGMGCTTLGGLRYTQGHLDEALALGERVATAFERCQVSGNRLDQLDPYVLRAHSLIELDRADEAEEVLGRAVVDGLQNRGLHLVSRARLYFLSGRWDDALAEIVARQGLPDIFGHGVVTNSMTALIAVHRGTADADLDWTGPDDRVGSQTYLHFDSWVDALLLESRGRPQEALAVLAEACRTLASGLAGSTVYYAYPDVARLAVAVGDRKVLDEITAAAEALDTRYSTLSRRGTVLLCRGLSLDQPELLEQAAQTFERAGRPLYAGQAREELAGVLARQGRSADARSALEAAVLAYAGMDARWDISRAESRLREHGVRRGSRGPRNRPKSGWQALTPTEHKVAELVAQGGSNSEIATRMFLSRRTVQTHVSSILNKLDLQSRVQVAVTLARQM